MSNNILGLTINQKPLSVLADEVISSINENSGQVVFACANPHSLAVAESDTQFKRALADADQLVTDGVGLFLLGKVFGLKLTPRITGSDYFWSIHEALNSEELGRPARVFFLGSSNEVLSLIGERMGQEYTDIELCGTYSPPFGDWPDELNREILNTINRAKPDVLWVGMTAPKQEKWVFENREALNVRAMGSIGAVFDFYAGTYPRAPKWLCSLGLEWMYRLVKEPKRMWKRTFLSVPKLLTALLKNQHKYRGPVM